jgi:membrane-associated phospholipid phosphatase
MKGSRFSATPIRMLLASLLPALLAAGTPSAAAEPTPLPVQDYPRLWWDDAGFTLTAPTRWDGQDWLVFSADSLAVVGTATLLDRSLRDWTQRQTASSWEKAVNHFETLGSTGSFAVIGGFYLEGVINHDPQAENTAVDALSASIVAAGLVTPVLKELAGRSRPVAHQGTYHFRPFSGSASFPSGHATQAFAVASVISMHYDSPWVGGVAYALAGLVGLARMDHNAHFASDVLAGAVIGTTVGRSLVRINDGKRSEAAAKSVAIGPWVTREGSGLAVNVNF